MVKYKELGGAGSQVSGREEATALPQEMEWVPCPPEPEGAPEAVSAWEAIAGVGLPDR